MQVLRERDGRVLCGLPEGSPLGIGLNSNIKSVPAGETYHYHSFHEYYVVLEGHGRLNVAGRLVEMEPNTIVMIQPGEPHCVEWIDPHHGVRFIIVKESSAPDTKHLATPEAEQGLVKA